MEIIKELSDFSFGAGYILSHNIISHDLTLVKEVLPDASILRLLVIDTLYLSFAGFFLRESWELPIVEILYKRMDWM